MDLNKQLRKFDFTLHDKDSLLDIDDIKELLKEIAKLWGFQQEQGEISDGLHFQGRLSLIGKSPKRIREMPQPFKDLYGLTIYYTPTSNGIKKSNFYEYVTKDRTRVAGPWTDADVISYIPKQYKNKMESYRPFQVTINNMCKTFNERGLCNVLYCPEGNSGKSTLAHTQRLFNNGIVLPSMNDAYRLSCTCMNILQSKNLRENVNIFFDLPRCMPEKKELRGLFGALEQISTGYIFDDRNKYKDWDFDTPNIWVFTNKMPNVSLLSQDRWRLWGLDDELNLIKYKEKEIEISDSDNEENVTHAPIPPKLNNETVMTSFEKNSTLVTFD